MHPQDDGDFREEHTRSVLYCSPAPDQRVLDTFESRYRVTTVASPAAVPEQPDAHFDCLVVDGDLYNEVGSSYPHPIESGSIPVIVFAERTDPGVPEPEREAVFEEGYSAGGDSGLGLSIVRTIVDAHGWDVSISESPMGGARFEITGVQFVDAAQVTATY